MTSMSLCEFCLVLDQSVEALKSAFDAIETAEEVLHYISISFAVFCRCRVCLILLYDFYFFFELLILFLYDCPDFIVL